MQPIESSSSYHCKRNTLPVLSPPLPPCLLPPPPQQQQQADSFGFTVLNDGGGGPNFCNTSYQLSSLSDLYYVAGLGFGVGVGVRDGNTVSGTTFLPLSTGEGMAPLFSKAPVFTASQRQELEKQTIICKYMMASLPVPPQLLLSLSKNQFPAPVHLSSSAITAASGLELRFSSRSDPEPWRCRRTDGKKWRCSRNVTHGQKYCERHAHKSKSRSRKPVEIQHKIPVHDSYGYANNVPISNISQPISHLPSMVSGTVASCNPTCEGAGGTMPFWTSNQQLQQNQMHSSFTTTMDLSRQNKLELSKKEGYIHHVQNRNNAGTLRWENRHRNSSNLNGEETMQTRRFIDAWSTTDKTTGLLVNKVSKKDYRKTPVSSLTLSIPGENEDDDDEDHHQEEQGGNPMRWERIKKVGNSNNLAGQWINAGTLGGPLGEALCLGIASNSNNSISTSRSSCEDPW